MVLESCTKQEEYNCSKFIVISDDFTGSNDCGVQFKNYGLSTVTVLNKDDLDKMYDYDVVVIDSETRNMTKQDSYQTMLDIGTVVSRCWNENIIYKKIDSTLRGNIVAELEALNDVLKPEVIIFVPAYPKNKRTTIHGIHYLNNVPIDKTELSSDPKNPINTSDVRELLKSSTKMDFVHIDVENIRNGEIFNILKSARTTHFSFDTENNEDLDLIVKHVKLLNKSVLWVGSAGLTDALANSLLSSASNKRKPVIAVVGSINSISAVQAQQAIMDESIAGVKIDVRNAILETGEEKAKLLNEIIGNIDSGFDVLLGSAIDGQQVIMALSLAQELGLSINEVSTRIADFMGDLLYQVLKSRKVSGVFLTGGDTAINVIRKLSAKAAMVVEEIETGVPYITLVGGPFEGLRIVTKAGSFGEKDTIVNAINYLRGSKYYYYQNE